MKSLRERLERKIESAGQDWQDQGCYKGQLIIENARTRWASSDFQAGAHSLLPLVLELAEVIEYYHSAQCTWIDGSLNVGPAKQALQSIEKFLEEK